LEGSLKASFLGKTWRTILAMGYVEDFLKAGETEEAWKELRGLAQDKLEEHREVVREAMGLSEEPVKIVSEDGGDAANHERFELVPRIVLPEREKKRAAVLLRIWMRKAAEHPAVKRFRSERLGGQQLYYDDTVAFISPGLREEITDWELAELARRLERDYGWRRDDAAWFVLTSRPPRLRPLTADVSMRQSAYGPNHCKITLHVAPWIPSEVVERAFVQLRDQVRGGAGPGTVSEKRLEVLRFVEEQRAKFGRRPNFEALLQIWNQEYPHWAYADYRALSKAYREAYQEVVHPKYHMPNAKRPET